MFEDLFDDRDESATFEQIMTRLDNISCSYIEEKQQVSYLENNKWQLFDEFDIYEFEMNI